MLSGITVLTGLCLLEIILAKIAIGNDKNEKISFDEFYDLHRADKR